MAWKDPLPALIWSCDGIFHGSIAEVGELHAKIDPRLLEASQDFARKVFKPVISDLDPRRSDCEQRDCLMEFPEECFARASKQDAELACLVARSTGAGFEIASKIEKCLLDDATLRANSADEDRRRL